MLLVKHQAKSLLLHIQKLRCPQLRIVCNTLDYCSTPLQLRIGLHINCLINVDVTAFFAYMCLFPVDDIDRVRYQCRSWLEFFSSLVDFQIWTWFTWATVSFLAVSIHLRSHSNTRRARYRMFYIRNFYWKRLMDAVACWILVLICCCMIEDAAEYSAVWLLGDVAERWVVFGTLNWLHFVDFFLKRILPVRCFLFLRNSRSPCFHSDYGRKLHSWTRWSFENQVFLGSKAPCKDIKWKLSKLICTH